MGEPSYIVLSRTYKRPAQDKNEQKGKSARLDDYKSKNDRVMAMDMKGCGKSCVYGWDDLDELLRSNVMKPERAWGVHDLS